MAITSSGHKFPTRVSSDGKPAEVTPSVSKQHLHDCNQDTSFAPTTSGTTLLKEKGQPSPSSSGTALSSSEVSPEAPSVLICSKHVDGSIRVKNKSPQKGNSGKELDPVQPKLLNDFFDVEDSPNLCIKPFKYSVLPLTNRGDVAKSIPDGLSQKASGTNRAVAGNPLSLSLSGWPPSAHSSMFPNHSQKKLTPFKNKVKQTPRVMVASRPEVVIKLPQFPHMNMSLSYAQPNGSRLRLTKSNHAERSLEDIQHFYRELNRMQRMPISENKS